MPSAHALTIGNFDGVHRGHAALVRTAREAVGDDGEVTALSFDPHPISTLRPGLAPARLTTFEQRCEYLRDLGADRVVRLTPSKEFLAQSPDEFVNAIVDEHRPDVIIEGPDFHFGRKRAGTVETLRELGGRFGYRTIVIDPIDVAMSDQLMVRASSSMIRWLIRHGRVLDAGLLLGRSYELIAPVEPGDRRGRELGVPTANLALVECIMPADGIYAGRAALPDGTTYPAAISIGTKPTYGRHPRVCEAHLIAYDGSTEQYGWTIRLMFDAWLRDQLPFHDSSALIDQLRRDIHRAAHCRQPAAAT